MPQRSDLRELTSDDLRTVAVLAEIATMFNASYDVEEVLSRVMEVVVDTLSAERGFILLDRGGEALEVVAAAGVAVEEVVAGAFNYSLTIVDQVLKEGKTILSHDASEDSRFSASKSLKSLNTRSILCVPMSTRDNTFGLIYVDNQNVSHLFMPNDLDLLKIIADMAASAIERAQFFASMLQKEKAALLGTFIGGIVHEMNSPLTSIMGLAEVARENLDDHATVTEYLDTIVAESNRCTRLIREMLSLARSEKRAIQRVNIGELITRTARLLKPAFVNQRVDLRVDVGTEAFCVNGDPDQLTQVLINLATNARLAVQGQEHAHVTLRVGVNNDGVALRRSDTAERLRIQVIDNGPGVAKENIRRIFEPFFTTRVTGEGTGLGLSIVQRIVSDHRGVITVSNLPEAGACFTVDLPRA